MEKKEYKISGLHCQHCVSRVKNVLLQQDGVNHVDISQENQTVSIEADNSPDINLLNDIIENLGNYKLSES